MKNNHIALFLLLILFSAIAPSVSTVYGGPESLSVPSSQQQDAQSSSYWQRVKEFVTKHKKKFGVVGIATVAATLFFAYRHMATDVDKFVAEKKAEEKRLAEGTTLVLPELTEEQKQEALEALDTLELEEGDPGIKVTFLYEETSRTLPSTIALKSRTIKDISETFGDGNESILLPRVTAHTYGFIVPYLQIVERAPEKFIEQVRDISTPREDIFDVLNAAN